MHPAAALYEGGAAWVRNYDRVAATLAPGRDWRRGPQWLINRAWQRHGTTQANRCMIRFDESDRELTERRKRANERRVIEQLQHLDQLKDEFLAAMSHELRTPLNAVLGLSEALQEEVYGEVNERQRKSLHTIEESGRHLLSLIKKLIST